MENLEEVPNVLPVLDSGWVAVLDVMGDDARVVSRARQSYVVDTNYGEVREPGRSAADNERLIKYLMRNKHTSPFEAVVVDIAVKCPIFVARQWMRHRTWAYSEVSGRYIQLPEDYYIPEVEAVGAQSTSNKQARDLNQMDPARARVFIANLVTHSMESFDKYREAISAGIPRELARAFLPLNTYTQFSGTVNLHNLFHFLRLRLHQHAQYEIRQYAMKLLHILSHHEGLGMCMTAFAETLGPEHQVHE